MLSCVTKNTHSRPDDTAEIRGRISATANSFGAILNDLWHEANADLDGQVRK